MPIAILVQSGVEIAGLPVQENHSDCSRVAQHALVLESSGHIESDLTVPAQPSQSTNPAIQSDPTKESEAVVAQIESQPDQSMRQVDHCSRSGATLIR